MESTLMFTVNRSPASGRDLIPRQVIVVLLGLMLAGARACSQAPTCASQGPVLALTGGRFGDAWSLQLSGPPGAPGLIATDPAAGPVGTPFGPVCLGLSGGLVTMPVTLDAAGNFATGGILPLAGIGTPGATIFAQAAVAVPSLPSGIGLTSGWAVTLRPPRIEVFTSGTAIGGLTMGNIAVIDPVTDTIASSTPAMVTGTYFTTRVPRLGWFAVPGLSPSTSFIDDFTGATALAIPGYYLGPGGSVALVVSSDGSMVVTGSGSGISIVTLHVYALPSGAPLATIGVPTTLIPTWILPIAGTPFIYTADTYWIRVLDVTTATMVMQTLVPGTLSPGSPQLVGNLLYVMTGAGMIAIDVTTHAIVMGPIPTGQPNAALVGYGPGPAGNALFSSGGDAVSGPTVAAISPQTLGVQATAPLPGFINGMSPGMLLSAGGTEWLLELWTPTSIELRVMSPATLQTSLVLPSIIAAGPTTIATTILRSNTLPKAYALTTATTLVPIPTDPIGTPGAPITLPFPGVVRSN